MRISLDTGVDTFESAIKTVHAAYGVPFDPQGSDDDDNLEEIEWLPATEGDEDYFPGKWTRARLRKLARWVHGADAEIALRYMAEHAPAVGIDEVFEHMGEALDIENFNGQNMGGRMSSVGFAQNSIKGVGDVYDTDYKHRKYRMDAGIAKVLLEELDALAE